MSDDSVENPIDQTSITGALRRPGSPFPWVLFGVTSGVLVAIAIVLFIQVSSERARVDEQALAYLKEAARAEKAEQALTLLKGKVAPMEAQVQALTAERDGLAVKVQTLTAELEKAAAGTPTVDKPPTPAQPPAKKIATKKKVVKKKRR